MKRALFALLGLVVFTTPAQAVKNPEIVMIESIGREILRKDVSEAARRHIVDISSLFVWGRLIAHAPVVQASATQKDSLRQQVTKEFEAHVWKMSRLKTRTSRQEALIAFLKRVTSQRTADNIVAQWLGLPPVNGLTLGGKAPQLPRPSLSDQLATDRTAGSSYSLDLAESVLVSDEGGPGEANGMIDRGEWITLVLDLRNSSPGPLFSSSAWVESINPCVWVLPSFEHELEELEQSTGHSSLPVTLYVASSCPSGTLPALKLRVKDSHLAMQTTIRVSLKASSGGRPPGISPNDVKLDTDVPGFSDGNLRRQLAPKMRFELTTKIRHPTASSIFTRWAFPAPMSRVLSNVSLRTGSYRKGRPGVFLPNDDIDAYVGAKDALRSAQQTEPINHWIKDRRTGPLWLAVDITIDHRIVGNLRLPSAASTTKTPPSATTVMELLRKHLAFQSRPVAPKTPNALGAVAGHDVILNSVAFKIEYNALVGGGRKAASYSADARGARYEHRVYVSVPMRCMPDCARKKCGPDGCGASCGDCPNGGKCNIRVGRCTDPNPCRNLECGRDPDTGKWCGGCSRGYTCDENNTCKKQICVPQCGGRQCGRDPKCPLSSCGECPGDQTCSSGQCRLPVDRPKHRIDLGLSMGFFDQLNSKLDTDFGKDVVWDDQSVPLAGFGLRYSVGSAFTFSGELSMVFGSAEIVEDEFVSLFVLNAGLAAGYVIYAGSVEIHPKLGIGFSMRNIDVGNALEDFTGANKGIDWELSTVLDFRFFGSLTLRVPVSDLVSVYVEAGFAAAGDPGPTFEYRLGSGSKRKQPLLDTMQTKIGAGLNFSF